jgi:hypothetical protein
MRCCRDATGTKASFMVFDAGLNICVLATIAPASLNGCASIAKTSLAGPPITSQEHILCTKRVIQNHLWLHLIIDRLVASCPNVVLYQ